MLVNHPINKSCRANNNNDPHPIPYRCVVSKERFLFIPQIFHDLRLELQQIVSQVAVRVGLARQTAALQFGDQTVAHLDDVASVEVTVEEQKAIAAYFLHHLLHHSGYMVGRSGEVDARFPAIGLHD